MSFRAYFSELGVFETLPVCFVKVTDAERVLAMYSQDRLDALAIGWTLSGPGRFMKAHRFNDEIAVFDLEVSDRQISVISVSIVDPGQAIG